MSLLKSRIIFSTRPMDGVYEFENVFVIRPAFELEPQPPYLMAKHPIILEVNPEYFVEEYEKKEWRLKGRLFLN